MRLHSHYTQRLTRFQYKFERLYFVVETKSSLFTDDLRDKESAKIQCGSAHFAELAKYNSPAAQFLKATKLDDVLAQC